MTGVFIAYVRVERDLDLLRQAKIRAIKKRETRRYPGVLCIEEEATILEKARICVKDLELLRKELACAYESTEAQAPSFVLSFLEEAMQKAYAEVEEARQEVHMGFYNRSHQNAWYHLFVIEEA